MREARKTPVLSTCSVDSINFARRNQISSCVLSDVTSHEGLARALSPKPTNRNVWTHRHGPRTTCNELWCGNHGLGDVSRFLLRALRNDESAAKAEFSKFLQGKLSDG